MNRNDIEKELYQAIQNTEDDLWEKIKSDAENVSVLPDTTVTRKPSFFPKRVLLEALALVLMVAGVFFYRTRTVEALDAKIYLDVNPSVEIDVTKNDKVLGVTALNEDGKTIIGDMDFKNSSLDVTVNALIGSMVRNGYLSELKNSILISVDANEVERATYLEDKLSSEIEVVLEESSLQGAILSQALEADQTITEKANQYNISSGKAQLIEDITQDSYHTFEDLVDLSINDLNLIYKNKTNVNSRGTASQKGYIGEDAAVTNALNYVGANRADISYIEIDLDYENERMVYEVEFVYQNVEHQIDVDATTGEIVKYDKDFDDDYITPNTQPQPSVAPQPTPPQQTTPTASITAEQAINTALSHAGIARGNAIDLDVELERNVYEVSFEANGIEYEYIVDAGSGQILSNKQERDD